MMFYIFPHVHIRCTWLYYERLAHTGTERLLRLIQQVRVFSHSLILPRALNARLLDPSIVRCRYLIPCQWGYDSGTEIILCWIKWFVGNIRTPLTHYDNKQAGIILSHLKACWMRRAKRSVPVWARTLKVRVMCTLCARVERCRTSINSVVRPH